MDALKKTPRPAGEQRMDTTVAVTRCENYDRAGVARALARQLELLGGFERFVKPGDRVLIKPNFIAPRSHRHAAQTHPAVVLEMARLLKDCGARPFVGDSPAWANVYSCARKLGLDTELARLAVPLTQLNRPTACRLSEKNPRVAISSKALEADVIINLPKFKTHQQLLATFAVKNMFGCVSGKRKALWHFRRGRIEEFCELLIEIYRYLAPAVTIIDAVAAMDRGGPIRGRDRQLGWLIGGTDPIACERICCELIGLTPEDVPIIRAAQALGFGCRREQIELRGDDYSHLVCADFELPQLVPVRFSLPHLCRSVCKQIVLLARSVRER